MKLTYLGDAHDHWKGSVFQYLQEGEILRNFLVDSMATDASPWNTANSKLYAHLLRIEESQLVQHGRTLSQDRKARRQYFLNIPRTGNSFWTRTQASKLAAPIMRIISSPRNCVS